MEEQYQDDEVGRVAGEFGNRASRMAGKAAGKVTRTAGRWAGKKILAVTLATGGGCLIPFIFLIVILMISGLLSAMTLNKKFDFEEIKKQAEQSGVSAQEELFNQIYDSSGKLLFTKQELDAMVFDKRSLKRMFEMISEYNTEELTEEINVEYEGTYNVWHHDGGYVYYMYEAPYYEQVSITKEQYEEYLKEEEEARKEQSETGETGRYEPPKRILGRGETGYYVEETTTLEEKMELDDTWIRKQYPVDWQIVYLLCYYDSFDNGNSSTELEEGEKLRLKKSYIESVINDVMIEYEFYAADASADCEYVRHGAGDDAHDLDVINYDWDKGLFASVSQDEIREYGAYISHASFTGTVWHGFNTYTATYSGNVTPVTKLKAVRTLSTVDNYNIYVAPQDSRDMMSQRYDLSKLEALLEKYGHGRSLDIFLAALKELPGGEEIAAPIEEAQIALELEEEMK